jgi:hypothetical protein
VTIIEHPIRLARIVSIDTVGDAATKSRGSSTVIPFISATLTTLYQCKSEDFTEISIVRGWYIAPRYPGSYCRTIFLAHPLNVSDEFIRAFRSTWTHAASILGDAPFGPPVVAPTISPMEFVRGAQSICYRGTHFVGQGSISGG